MLWQMPAALQGAAAVDARLGDGMPYLTVITLAAAAGGAVAAFTLFQGRPRPNEAAGGPPAQQAQPQTRALPPTPTAQTRLIGALGLLVAVLAGAGLIALLCYLAYAAMKRAFGG